MADPNTDTIKDSNTPNQTIRAEQAKAEMGGQHQSEKAKPDEQPQENSAIGGSHPADKPEELKKNQESVTPR